MLKQTSSLFLQFIIFYKCLISLNKDPIVTYPVFRFHARLFKQLFAEMFLNQNSKSSLSPNHSSQPIVVSQTSLT
jgi:hypothetical protein